MAHRKLLETEASDLATESHANVSIMDTNDNDSGDHVDRKKVFPLSIPSYDSEDWTLPPKNKDGSIIHVTFRIGIENVKELSTVESSAWINIAVTMYWTDLRLVGWKGDLPPKLWGPHLVLVNKLGLESMQVFDEVFALVNHNGRLKRGVVYQGKITNPMSLLDFPYDCDTLDFHFHSSSHWKTLDGSKQNMVTIGQTYTLSEVTDVKEGACSADPFCRLENPDSGNIPEWELHGYSYDLELETQVTGIRAYECEYRLLLSRKTGYYVWKILAPLWQLQILNTLIFFYPPEELDPRMNLAVTLVLTSFATIYVIGSLLPIVDFLTCIDKVVTLNVAVHVISSIESVLVYHVTELAQYDLLFGFLIMIFYVFGCMMFLIPKISNKKRVIEGWKTHEKFNVFAQGKQ
mmetsp:Transcript_7882/g.14636  ORF Transcript_7882/g.14636 Transcript_7882/m.14636 type:complete len:405 (+) Transcript_7882:155-1369(+)|eukprot:CAMPEP_0197518078 /NCGR_PEP_ID=MMETSP1318-20131121/3192_1 /TAXON_ID=552666 /ORGANISM="Partenskyella glossopodia, Strain RCC365" /LENGTH=404 /DNA_ID=CAMNT_0043068139 /DNA_START=149 /DNA_END=1363 /DNA_ORIENTATION=+